jgi:hypothetical protein
MEPNQMGAAVILPDFVLTTCINRHWQYSGMDSIDLCLNRQHFLSYPYSVEYVYNSRGYRDQEWPNSLDELKNAIWCVGDSFTVGIGQPFDHIWPQVLSKQLNQRTINVSMDGASNHWIARRAQAIIDLVKPGNLVILWSYTHRREKPNTALNDEQRRIPYSKNSVEDDYSTWITLLNGIRSNGTNVIHSTIPDFHPIVLCHEIWNNIKDPSWPTCPRNITELENLPGHILDEMKHIHRCYNDFKTQLESNIIHIHERLDWARDYHHFDLLTAQWLVDQICSRWSN